MPRLTPQAYAAQIADAIAGSAATARAPDRERGRLALTQYACQACHMIPGVTGPRVYVGPPLENIGGRTLIAGRLPNAPDNLVRWMRNPQYVDARTAMPG